MQGAGVLFVQNSSLSGNAAPYGGAIVNEATLTVLNSTLLNNTSNAGNGGGVRSAGNLSLRNTIIASSGASVDCVKVGGTIVTNTYSLIGDGSATCSVGGLGLLTGDPLLGPLADNGGGTRTHAPLAGSPVLNSVWDASCPASDQRGVARPYGARCDIGAVEGRPEADVSKSVAPTGPITYHGVVTYTIAIFRSFGLIFMLTQGGPSLSTNTLVWEVYQAAFGYLRFGLGAAISVVLLLTILLLSVPIRIFQREDL